MDTTRHKQIIEAALLASTQPLSMPQLESLFAGEDNDAAVSHADIAAALAGLQEDCADRGIELVEVASGFRFQVRREVHPFVARLWTERPSRYSRALLETLALIAYRQPVTRGDIEQVRGVSVSSHITKTLEEREWIRVVGHRDTPGRPALFGTTRHFLDYFNLKALDQLPPLTEILNLEDADPQLGLGDDNRDPDARVGPPATDVPTDDDAKPSASGDQAGPAQADAPPAAARTTETTGTTVESSPAPATQEQPPKENRA